MTRDLPERDDTSKPRVTRRRMLGLLTATGIGYLAAPRVQPALDAVSRFDFDHLLDRVQTRMRPPVLLEGAEAYGAFLSDQGITRSVVDRVLRAHVRNRQGVANCLPPRELWPHMAQPLRVAQAVAECLGESSFAINSAYRSPAYNAQLSGSAKRSQHLQNRALDLVYRAEPKKVAAAARQLRADGFFRGGVGLYSSFVHIDTRGANADWTG